MYYTERLDQFDDSVPPPIALNTQNILRVVLPGRICFLCLEKSTNSAALYFSNAFLGPNENKTDRENSNINYLQFSILDAAGDKQFDCYR